MQSLSQIVHFSIKSTSRNPRWWILALSQIISLLVLSWAVSYPIVVLGKFSILAISGVLLLAVMTEILWKEIEIQKFEMQKPTSHRLRAFPQLVSLIILNLAILALVKSVVELWIFFAPFSSLITATCVLASMFAVFSWQGVVESINSSLFTWNKKFSLVALFAFVLMASQAISFAFIKGFLEQFPNFKAVFELLRDSATIWMLLPVVVVCAVLVAFLNAFLVSVFLETVDRKKDTEAEKELANPVLEPNL